MYEILTSGPAPVLLMALIVVGLIAVVVGIEADSMRRELRRLQQQNTQLIHVVARQREQEASRVRLGAIIPKACPRDQGWATVTIGGEEDVLRVKLRHLDGAPTRMGMAALLHLLHAEAPSRN